MALCRDHPYIIWLASPFPLFLRLCRGLSYMHPLLLRIKMFVHFIRDIARDETTRALIKCPVPTLVGAVPTRSTNLFTYGNGRQIFANRFNDGHEDSYVHLCTATIAGIVTGTAMNPIWVVKTRLQLFASDRSLPIATLAFARGIFVFGGSFATIRQVAREEGVRGFYRAQRELSGRHGEQDPVCFLSASSV